MASDESTHHAPSLTDLASYSKFLPALLAISYRLLISESIAPQQNTFVLVDPLRPLRVFLAKSTKSNEKRATRPSCIAAGSVSTPLLSKETALSGLRPSRLFVIHEPIFASTKYTSRLSILESESGCGTAREAEPQASRVHKSQESSRHLNNGPNANRSARKQGKLDCRQALSRFCRHFSLLADRAVRDLRFAAVVRAPCLRVLLLITGRCYISQSVRNA